MELVRHAVAQCSDHYDPTHGHGQRGCLLLLLVLVVVVLAWWRDQGSLPPPARTSEEPGRVNAVARFSGIVCRILKDNNNWSTQQTVDYKQGLQSLQIQLTCMNNTQGRLSVFLLLTIVHMNLYGTNLDKQKLQLKG